MKYKINEICTIINGSTPSTKKQEYWNGNIPWITPKDMSLLQHRFISNGERYITQAGYESCSTTLVPKNTILLTSRAPIGYLAIAQNELCTNQGFKSLICNEVFVHPYYLYYLLLTKIDYLKSIAGGSTFKELSKEQLGNMEIHLPTLDIQHNIVNTIGTVDNLIENLQYQNDKIKRNLTLFFSNLIPSKEIRLCDISIIKYGKSIEASALTHDYNYPVYGSNGIIGTLSSYMFDDIKIAISCRGASSGNLLLTQPKSTISSNSLYLDLFNSSYTIPLYFYLKKAGLTTYVTGSAQPQITIENIKDMKVPDFSIIRNNKNDLVNLMFKNIAKINELKKIKGILLSKYF